ncbi:hypothetical protein Theco_4029 (plasmid) [Thermobacillus composti KWC4]|jgi:hypothetical protein|uniref:ABC transporter permease n=1 Tax=Thermobacillus composti (strain DSM 18247 / JCM 13945 / KWC4) TaxID=717605 RepID=L0EJR9_THECK|nr:hypothetical protein [Thermobacillus composti]AGA60031.1 hypothetical protein Theco_4029 [Thermobacillus composti KWC4]
MSTNASKALYFGASLLLTIALITIGVMVFLNAQDGAKTATKKFSGLNVELSQAEFVAYDNSVVSGSNVVNAIRKYTGPNYEFGISVKTGKASTAVWYGRQLNTTVPPGTAGYGSVIGNGTGTISNAQNETSSDYVNPNGTFTSQIVKDENNVVRGIVFVQQ